MLSFLEFYSTCQVLCWVLHMDFDVFTLTNILWSRYYHYSCLTKKETDNYKDWNDLLRVTANSPAPYPWVPTHVDKGPGDRPTSSMPSVSTHPFQKPEDKPVQPAGAYAHQLRSWRSTSHTCHRLHLCAPLGAWGQASPAWHHILQCPYMSLGVLGIRLPHLLPMASRHSSWGSEDMPSWPATTTTASTYLHKLPGNLGIGPPSFQLPLLMSVHTTTWRAKSWPATVTATTIVDATHTIQGPKDTLDLLLPLHCWHMNKIPGVPRINLHRPTTTRSHIRLHGGPTTGMFGPLLPPVAPKDQPIWHPCLQ